MFVSDPLGQLSLVIAIAFLVNSFAALQDVAVDGMAIDVLPEQERGRANAFMAFGQVAGFSAFSAISGVLLAQFGIAAAAATAALTIAAVFVLITLVRERSGERLLPWTPGVASARTAPVESTFSGIFKGLFSVLLLPMSVVLTLAEDQRMRDGGVAVVPVVAPGAAGAGGLLDLQDSWGRDRAGGPRDRAGRRSLQRKARLSRRHPGSA
jgi:PAT family beta-lactamase induction signal transducer AmpG